MRRLRRALGYDAVFSDSEVLLCESQRAYQLAPGHEARRLACVICGQAAGGEMVRMIMALTGVVCPNDGDHLLGGGHLRHEQCPRPSDQELALRLVTIMAGDD